MKSSLLYLLLIPVPILWVLLDYVGALDGWRNAAMDLRFRVRGEMESPVKVVYVNMDAKTFNLPFLGERPWDRRFFADVGNILFEYGQARAVGFDFVFSPKTASSMVPEKNIFESDQALASLVHQFPDRVVLAADYTGVLLPDIMRVPSRPPLQYLGYRDPATNPFPEAPTFPIITYNQGEFQGRIGIISVDELRSGGAIPRWCPMYYEYEGEAEARNVLYGLRFYYGMQGLDTELVTDGDLFRIEMDGAPLFEIPRVSSRLFLHFSLELMLAAEGLGREAAVPMGDRMEVRAEDGTVLWEIPLVDGQLTEINWFSPWDSDLNIHVSIFDLFYYSELLFSEDPEEVAEAEAFYRQFEDAIILVGPTDKLLQDLAPTPFDAREVPKVGVHGNLLKTLYSQRFIHRLSDGKESLIALALTVAVVIAVLYSGRFSVIYKFAGVLIVLFYLAVVFTLFGAEDLVLPLVVPLGSAFSTAFLGLTGKLVMEERQKGRIKGMFGTYVSPELVDHMVNSGEEPQLGGHEEQITAFFSDIQSFSAFSEVLTPYRLVELMNAYLTAMTDILQEDRGTLDKYIGDAIVAMFGAPLPLENHAFRACRTAARVQHKQAELREAWASMGDTWPPLVHRMRTRIGLNTGPAIVGNMGSNTRFNYTMMGDTVNLAARSESGAKSYGVFTMVTEETYRACEASAEGQVCFRFLDKIRVKGRNQPVSMYELVDLREHVSPDEQKGVDLYHEGIEHYLAQRWDAALAAFEGAKEFERFNPQRDRWIQTNPSLVMIARCQLMKQHPPEGDWDGVYVMKTK